MSCSRHVVAVMMFITRRPALSYPIRLKVLYVAIARPTATPAWSKRQKPRYFVTVSRAFDSLPPIYDPDILPALRPAIYARASSGTPPIINILTSSRAPTRTKNNI